MFEVPPPSLQKYMPEHLDDPDPEGRKKEGRKDDVRFCLRLACAARLGGKKKREKKNASGAPARDHRSAAQTEKGEEKKKKWRKRHKKNNKMSRKKNQDPFYSNGTSSADSQAGSDGIGEEKSISRMSVDFHRAPVLLEERREGRKRKKERRNPCHCGFLFSVPC